MSKHPEYSMDSDSLIRSWQFNYRTRSFPDVWNNIEREVAEGRIVASEEVAAELARQKDELYEWFASVPGFIEPTDREVQEKVRAVLAAHPTLIRLKKNRSGADPFVIAVAMKHNCTVVTEENPTRKIQKPAIPDVCTALGIDCIKMADMIEREGWVYHARG